MDIPEDLEITLQEVRSQWEFASVCQFLNLFYNAVGLETFDTDDFETDLITGKSNANIIKLQMKLLKSLTGLNNILLNNYQQLIVNEYKKRNLECLITEELDFFDLPIREKILILYNLCEWQFENSEAFRSRITEEDQQTWRVEPIGYDQKGNTYWLFDDNRLYKELPDIIIKPKTRKGKRRHRRDTANSVNKSTTKENKWQLVCLTSEDWINFPKQFENTKFQMEKEFYDFVTTFILPKVLNDLKSKEKKRRLQEDIIHRKRSSRIQMKEIEKFERERKAELERLRKEEELRIKREELKRKKEEERLRQIQLEKERKQREREEKIRIREEQKQKERKEQELREIRYKRNKVGPGKDGESYVFNCICNHNELNIENNEIPLIMCEQCNTWMHIPCLAMKLLRLTEQPLELYNDDIEDWRRILFICPRCKAKELNIDYDKVIHKKKRRRTKRSKKELKRKRKERSEIQKKEKERSKGTKKQARKRRKIMTENGEITVIENDNSQSVNNNTSTPSNYNNVTIINSDGQVVKLSKYKLKKLEETPEQKAERERLKQERKEQRRQLRMEKKQKLKLERREQRRKERLERKEQEKMQKKLEKERLRQERKEKLQLEKLIEKMKKKNLVVFGPVGPDGQPPILVPNQLKQHKPRAKKHSMQNDNIQFLNNSMSVSTFISNFSEDSTSNNENLSNQITSSNESTPLMINSSLHSFSSEMNSNNSSVALNGLENHDIMNQNKMEERKYNENDNNILRKGKSNNIIQKISQFNNNNNDNNNNNSISFNSNNINPNFIHNIDITTNKNNNNNYNNNNYNNYNNNNYNNIYNNNNNNDNNNTMNSILSPSSNNYNTPSWNSSMINILDNKNYMTKNVLNNNSKISTTISPQDLSKSVSSSKYISHSNSYSNSNNILQKHNQYSNAINSYLNTTMNNNIKSLYPILQPNSQQHSTPINPKLINTIPNSSNNLSNLSNFISKSNVSIYSNHIQNPSSNTSKKEISNSTYNPDLVSSSKGLLLNNENKNISNYSQQQSKLIPNSQNFLNHISGKMNSNNLNFPSVEEKTSNQTTIHTSHLLNKINTNTTVTNNDSNNFINTNINNTNVSTFPNETKLTNELNNSSESNQQQQQTAVAANILASISSNM